MRQFLLILLPVFFPSVLGAEVSVRVDAPPRAGAGARVEWNVVAKNDGPEPTTVEIQTSFDNRSFACSIFRTVEPAEEVALPCYAAAPEAPGRYQIVANTTPADIWPRPPAVTTSADVDVVLAPDLTLTFSSQSAVLRGGRVAFDVLFDWYTPVVPSPAAILTIHLDPRLQQVQVPAPCRHDAEKSLVVCTIAAPAPDQTTRFRIDAIAPSEGTGVPLVTRAEVTTNDPREVTENLNNAVAVTETYRTFTVTTTADAGPGSLRAAIKEVNAVCDQAPLCEIAFAIDAPEARWHTIRPESPLPRLVASALLFDGSSQSVAHGDTNSEGPEIEISGTRLGEGDGVIIDAPCGATVRGVVINGFPGTGLLLSGNRRCRSMLGTSNLVEGNFLGTDATGTTAIANERGVVIDTPRSWNVKNNVISGNRRSGLFLWWGPVSMILRNRIGLRAHEDLPLGNGGSGVFIGSAAMGTDLDDNYIAFNREMGVAVAASYVRIGSNSIHANGLLGIDVGLDGPGGSDAPPPRIVSAIYDPATGQTTVEGVGTSAGSFGPDEVLVFANDACDGTGGGEGQYTLGRATGMANTTNFRFVHQGDLTGKFITATTTIRQCLNCFAANSIESQGINFGVYSRTTEFGECQEVVRKP